MNEYEQEIFLAAFEDELEKIAGVREGLGHVWEGVIGKAVGPLGGKRHAMVKKIVGGGPTRQAALRRMWKATPGAFKKGYGDAFRARKHEQMKGLIRGARGGPKPPVPGKKFWKSALEGPYIKK
ncbi:MAG: hypothetical protein GWO24_02555 [Akkermansiaceae bacterium]|nr:hypothetical protein [Akkermansiaceae bacterium]